jgi:hypothetical protein
MGNWERFGNDINNAFFFVVDKIIDLEVFFHARAYEIGRIVLLIAIFSAALNYALTGQGLKENVIKILKATLFFLIIMAAYPRIIGFITSWTFDLAKGSIGDSVERHFKAVTQEVTETYTFTFSTGAPDMYAPPNSPPEFKTFTNEYIRQITGNDQSGLFSDISKELTHTGTNMKFRVISPAAVLKVVLFLAGECFLYADNKTNTILPEFSRVLKGLVCGFFLAFTGAIALLEYIVCFLEFMFVASVGIILFPLSIWEGSKFASEGFIKAIFGFFTKQLFCNLAIFLMLYGFISLFYIVSKKVEVDVSGNQISMGFTGNIDQIIFIIFVCLLFFFICKSAPGIAQSLHSGSPTLSAAGAIGAVAGAVGAAAAIGGMAKNAGNSIKNTAGSVVGGIAKTAGTLSGAGAASKAAGEAGGSRINQAGAFMSSLTNTASQGLARSLYGDQSKGQSMGEMNDARKQAGAETGNQYVAARRPSPPAPK